MGESVQMRLKELEAELEEEEITKKGFWKQKYQLVETFLNKKQVKDISAAQAESKAGKMSDKEYFAKLKDLLIPAEAYVDEGVKDEDEAMNWDESPKRDEKKIKDEKENDERIKDEKFIDDSGDSEEPSGSGSSSSKP